MPPIQILIYLLLTLSGTNALSLPRLFKPSPETHMDLTAVSHLITLNRTLPTNVEYNDVYLYINPTLNMDLRVPGDNLWRPVSNLICIKRMGFGAVNGTVWPMNCSRMKVVNATNYGDVKCKLLDTISWYIDLDPWVQVDTQVGTGKPAHVCCGDDCSFAGFHF